MNISKLPAFEASFVTDKTDSEGKLFKLTSSTVSMPGDSSGPLNITVCEPASGDNSFYYTTPPPDPSDATKKRIVLHFTEGYIKGDIAALTTPGNHVSVPFVIARDGSIYNLWASKYWSYHLGKGCVGGNSVISPSSIGIELSNIGPLTLSGSSLLTGNGDTYCSLSDTDDYTALPAPYRGYSYYASFTEEQYKSLITLLRFLTTKYSIPRRFLDEPARYNLFATDALAKASTGIVSHVNFRAPGEKVDIGPAFDWKRVIAAVTA
ncbi:MAG: N-acetylmuramoyl-L-alanine amidase [Sphingobacteriia bacterium]|nr:N-acetylmuramoyl-L-alanine amidase [Sphingobacteriia bacterium]